ncbi:MAG TPA: tRNA (adenosine(37)-N6)-dimethylallyltransferase MiaA [Terriglobales bacterium]|jgi:tRNA dimethylallyltransferase|nr:tRNA (adenosine(37)-N6)-dimethylallyltransferase MiaA [Terriglobales bacterium]
MTQSAQTEPLLVVILGPTASGKSALAIALAQRSSGEIVSCDSVAVYRHFEIGTAKPTREERAIVPHHLIDVVEPGEPFTAGDYSRRARAAINNIAVRGHLPIVVGGTGLYLRALLEGLFPGPKRSEELRMRLRERAAERGSEYLHQILRRLDPAAAGKIHANDAPKLIRAIEICLATRARMSELWQQRGRDPLRGFRILRIGLKPAREKLYARINLRAQQMFEHGLVEEAKSLLSRYGNAGAVTPLESLGYKQAAAFLRSEMTWEQAIAAAQQGHRNYAKRQMTWFRREPDVTWLEGLGHDPDIVQQAGELVSSHLAAHISSTRF